MKKEQYTSSPQTKAEKGQWDMTPPEEADFESDVEDLTATPPEIASTYQPSREKLNQLKFFIDYTQRGECSMLAISREGKAEIISEYHDVMPDWGFDDSECLKQNPDLHHALTELADDIATVDATHGDVLNDPDHGTQFYDNLRKILEYREINATPEERELIDDYFDVLGEMGNALSLMLFRMEKEAPLEIPDVTEASETQDSTSPEVDLSDVQENAIPGPYGIEPTYDDFSVFDNLSFTPDIYSRGQQSIFVVGHRPDGKQSLVLSSEYMDVTAHSEHLVDIPAIKDNTDLIIAIDSLTTDLALIDSSRGRNIDKGDPAKYARNYIRIQRWLNSSKATPEAKTAIENHLDKLRAMGPAFSVIEQLAAGIPIEKEDEEAGEKAARRRTVEANLESLEHDISQLEKQLNGAEEELANYQRKLQAALEETRKDTDEIRYYNRHVEEILDDIDLVLTHLRERNEESISYFMQNCELFNDDEQSRARHQYYERDETIQAIHKKQYDRRDECDHVKHIIRRLEDIQTSFSNW